MKDSESLSVVCVLMGIFVFAIIIAAYSHHRRRVEKAKDLKLLDELKTDLCHNHKVRHLRCMKELNDELKCKKILGE